MERPVLIKTLNEEAYQSKRIPCSLNILINHINRIEKVVPDKKQPIVVYCADADCDASPKVANALTDKGYNPYSLVRNADKQVSDSKEGLKG